jgi:hypothetical protein
MTDQEKQYAVSEVWSQGEKDSDRGLQGYNTV